VTLARSSEPTIATDLQWPALILALDSGRLNGIAVEGLASGTTKFYSPEIEESGGTEAWLRARYDRPQIWRDRLRLAADSVAALAHVLSRLSTSENPIIAVPTRCPVHGRPRVPRYRLGSKDHRTAPPSRMLRHRRIDDAPIHGGGAVRGRKRGPPTRCIRL